MNERKYWKNFCNSGRIEDYLSYKENMIPKLDEAYKDMNSGLGAESIERFRSCNRDGTQDEQPGRI